MFVVNRIIRKFVLWLTTKKMSRKKTNTKQKKDPQYMLFVFGDLAESSEVTQYISSQLLTIVSSQFLKYTYGEYGIVFNFRSDETFDDLKEYVDMALSDLTDQYFLLETTKNFEIKMPRKMKKDFLNIDNQLSNDIPIAGSISKEEKPKFNWDEKKIITFDFLLPVINQNFENITEEIVEEEPSIDDILDKISERGIDSLTKRETEILENYGKRKN
jgi:hypothetical protein